MGNAAGIISMVPLAIMLAVMLISGLIGLIRGLKKTVFSLMVVGASIILSLILTLILCNPKGGALVNVLDKVTGPMFETMGLGALAEVEAFSTVSHYYVSMLAGPFVFMALFYVLRFIIGIVMKFFVKKIPIMNNIPKVAKKLGGLGAGMAMGFIVIMITMMPILGTLDVMNTAITEMSAAVSQDDAGANDVTEVFDGMTNKGAGKTMRVLGGDLLYSATSNKKYEGQKVTLKTEISGMSHLLTSLTSLGGDFSNFEGEDNAFTKIADATEESPLISLLTAECISTAADKWRNGEEFMGVSSLGGDEPLIKPLMDAVLEVFAATEGEYLAEDLRSIGSAIGVLGKYGLLDESGDQEGLLKKLNNTPILSEMAAALHSNPRMSKVEQEVSSLGLRAFANVVGVPQEGDENYEEYKQMTKSIAESLNNSADMTKEEKRDMVKSELVNAAADYGTDLEGEVADQITDNFVEEFGDRDDVTDEEIEEFIEKYQNDVNA